VTGVQTCALPISLADRVVRGALAGDRAPLAGVEGRGVVLELHQHVAGLVGGVEPLGLALVEELLARWCVHAPMIRASAEAGRGRARAPGATSEVAARLRPRRNPRPSQAEAREDLVDVPQVPGGVERRGQLLRRQ